MTPTASAAAPVTQSKNEGVGGRRVRLEDPRLLRGEARFVADIAVEGALHASFVRSPRPHGRIRNIDVREAEAVSGVRAVITSADLESMGAGSLHVGWTHPGQRLTETELLPTQSVRWVGHPVAVVLAESAYIAEDAAERVQLEIEDLPVVTSVRAALAVDAPRLYDDWPDNVLAEHLSGIAVDEEIFRSAAVRLKHRFYVQRQAASPLESRAIVADYDPGDDRVTAWMSVQRPHRAREVICEACRWPENRLRVIAPDVGGSFGLKEEAFAEEVLVCLLARHLRRPIRWIEDRREALIGSAHCRQCEWDLELAADGEGRILGLRGEVILDVGAQPTNAGIGTARIAADMLPGPYMIEQYGVLARGVVTNKTPSGAYRGFGLPEAAFAMERLMDLLAGEVGIDPADVRRRNFIEPSQFPYATPTQRLYDSGDYERALDLALEAIDYESFEERRDGAKRRGRLRGIGIASYVKSTGLPPSAGVVGLLGLSHGNYETVTVRMNRSARLTVLTGVSSQGQGHRTSMAQICADVIGVDAADVEVVQGDSELTPYSSMSTGGSRVAIVAGGAVFKAASLLRDKLVRIAAFQLGVGDDEIELAGRSARVVDDPDRCVPMSALALAGIKGSDLPDGMDPGLEATATTDSPGGSFTFGTHVTEIEIDPITGGVELLRYVAVDDCGNRLSPTIVEGQLLGGIAQGLGGAMLEEVVYDAEGQILTASLMDYLLPLAEGLPPIELIESVTPSPHTQFGVKGVGEAGTVAPAAAVANAVANAIGIDAAVVDRLPFAPAAVAELVGGWQ